MLEQIINQYLKEQEATPHTASGKFSCGDAKRCHTYRYKKRQGTEALGAFDDRTLRVFEVGHIFHKWVQDILSKKGVLLASEVRVEDEHRAGIIDAIVQSDGKVILYDLKTVHSGKFTYLKKEDDLHYHYQAATYTSMYHKNYYRDFEIDETRICYISKDDLRIKEVPVLVTPQQLNEDWLPLIVAWDMKQEPKPNPLPWECALGGKSKKAYCPFIETCEHLKEFSQTSKK